MNSITDKEFNGPIANLIKVSNAYKGKNVREIINVLRRPNLEDVLEEVKYSGYKTDTEKILEKEQLKKNQKERADIFGIGM